MPKVSVIIPTMPGREDLLKRLKDSLPSDVDVVVVNGVGLLANKRNVGAKAAYGEYLLFIDDDNYMAPTAINELVESMRGDIGIVGMMACYHDKPHLVADGGSWRNYTTGLTGGYNTNFDLTGIQRINPYYVDEVANAFMIRADLFNELGGFDEARFPIDLDEADLCKRVKDSGYKILLNPQAKCFHDSQTYSRIPDFRRPLNAYMMSRNKVLFQKKHTGWLEQLVYFSIFMPLTWLGYMVCLLYRRKPGMALEFTKGMWDGLRGRLENKYQS